MPNEADCLRRHEATVCRWLAENGISLESRAVLAAFSGGADSTAMLLLLQRLSGSLGFRLAACHVDHGIRGAEAARDAAFCAEFCARQQIPFVLKRGDAPALNREKHTGMEDAARMLRYRLLAEAAAELGIDDIATAHTAEDHLETLLLHLTRGSGLAGLGGIPARNGAILRPILPLTRADTEAIVFACGEQFVTDSTNVSDLYARNRLRHQVVPVLRSLNPAVAQTALENSRVISAENAYLDRLAAELLEKTCENGAIDAEKLLAADAVLQMRAVRLWAKLAGVSLSLERTQAVMALLRSEKPSAQCDVGEGLVVRKAGGKLWLGVPAKEAEPFSWTVQPGETERLNPSFSVGAELIDTEKIHSVYKLFNHCLVNCDTINGEIKVRSRLSGDTFQKNAKSGTKTLKQLMIDRKIPRELRGLIPVVADDTGVIWVWGLGYNAARKQIGGNKWYHLNFCEHSDLCIQNHTNT